MKLFSGCQKLILIASSAKGPNDRLVHWFKAGEALAPRRGSYTSITLESDLAAGSTVFVAHPRGLNRQLAQLYQQEM